MIVFDLSIESMAWICAIDSIDKSKTTIYATYLCHWFYRQSKTTYDIKVSNDDFII